VEPTVSAPAPNALVPKKALRDNLFIFLGV
jgi:hypothetical protein